MANNKNYKGSLRLDWINKELSLYYEIDEKEGKGVRPVWVSKNDIRVAEPRILKFVKSYGDTTSENMLIKGDNLLVLRSLVEMFKGKPEKEKVKCIYIDPPFNTGNAFKHYDDNLEHSEWLTMMRDRLFLLRKLLRKDGILFLHLDDREVAYCRVLIDEIFGRQNYLNTVTIKANSPFGFKHTSNQLFKSANNLIIFAKDVAELKFKKTFIEKGYDPAYRWVFDNIKIAEEKWSWKRIDEVVSNDLSFKSPKEAKDSLGDNEFDAEIGLFAIKNPDRVFRTASVTGGARLKRIKTLGKSRKLKNKVIRHPNDDMDYIFIGGERVLFYKERLQEINGNLLPVEVITDIWDDISWEGISREGGIDFPKSKKPERLIQRIIELSTEKGDLVFDSFAGSGTTGAVAQKIDRRWIMVELGCHAEELIIPRMQRVFSGKDQSGISKEVSWKGGGGFKYYQLGESVINEQDMNWKLKAEEMAEAIFLHFQYRPMKAEWLEKENMYLGKHQFSHFHFALSFATREVKVITEDLYEKIIAGLEKEKFKHLTIFTNVAVAVSPESLDERILVKKIPAAILREYNLI